MARASNFESKGKQDYLKPCAAEFLGCFLLVLTVGCNVLSSNATWGNFSIACVYMVSIYAFANVSGAHLNPAVTIALQLAGKIKKDDLPMTYYILSQFSGGLAGALGYRLLFQAGFRLAPTPGCSLGALICEFIYTFMICYVVLNTAASKRKGGKNQYFGIAIAFVVLAGGYASAAVGAGCFNPAVAFGIFATSFHQFQGFGWLAMYTTCEVLGALVAFHVFKVVRPEEQDKEMDDAPAEGYTIGPKLLSEAIGTFMIVFTVGNNVLGHSKAMAISVAAAMTSMIYATGDISGGHFNPAITVAVHCCGKRVFDGTEMAKYIFVQVVAAMLAATAYALCHSGHTFPLGPGIGHNWLHVAMGEAIFTFLLCLVFLCMTMLKKPAASELGGFIIGSCITVGGLAIGAISGGALNPAVAAGIAFVHIIGGGFFWKSIVYTICELAGAGAAALAFKNIYSDDFNAKEEEEPLDGSTKARV